MKDVVIFDTMSTRYPGENFIFSNPEEVITAFELCEVDEAVKKAEEWTQNGYYAAGYIKYEAGYAFEEKLKKYYEKKRWEKPIVWFGIFKNRDICFSEEEKNFTASNFVFSEKETDYTAKIDRIKEHIRNGETYQINFTGKINFDFSGDGFSFYNTLKTRQSAGYTAYIRNRYEEILSFSPELFFKKSGVEIMSKPMKGTSPRGKNLEEDVKMAEILQNSEKNCAENVMITDLIRNDMGRVAKIGSVKAERIFDVERYETLFQMTSTVTAKLRDGISYPDIFHALFPCGSITGAPKISSMEIIHSLESGERGIYTGSIGYITPDGDAVFNIAIRTVTIEGSRGEMGVGSGIVWDSVGKEEYRECILKSRFLTAETQKFKIVESLLLNNGRYRMLDRHINRIIKTSEYFCFRFEEKRFVKILEEAKKYAEPGKKYKVRVTLEKNGKVDFTVDEIKGKIKKRGLRFVMSEKTVDSKETNLYFKTDKREIYNEVFSSISKSGYDEAIFLNENGEVTECCNNNIIIKINGEYITPPVKCGLLAGTMREAVLEKVKNIKEKPFYAEDLKCAEEIIICNSVRGIRRGKLY